MLNVSNLKSIAQESETAKNVFEELSTRMRFRFRTNLNKVRNDLRAKGKGIVDDDLIQVFKHLEDQGVGKLVIGRGNKPTRFVWHYNLKDVAHAAMSQDSSQGNAAEVITPESEQPEVNNIRPIKPPTKPLTNKRGRPKGSKNKTSRQDKGVSKNKRPLNITINLRGKSTTGLTKLLKILKER